MVEDQDMGRGILPQLCVVEYLRLDLRSVLGEAGAWSARMNLAVFCERRCS